MEFNSLDRLKDKIIEVKQRCCCHFRAGTTIRSMRCRRVSPGAARHGRGRLFSEGHPDWEVEPLRPRPSIWQAFCKPLN
jgi:hypothetical protein